MTDDKSVVLHGRRSALKTGVAAAGSLLTAVVAPGRRADAADASAECRCTPPQAAQAEGAWSDVFAMPNVAVHTQLLPSGKVLLWGRRDLPTGTLDDHFCTPYLWDPATRIAVPTPQPRGEDGSTVNLFCAGHAMLSDGKLLVAGGHIVDSVGLDQACLYDFATNTWTPLPAMNNGRWYPTVVALANGHAVVLSGSFAGADGETIQNNNIPQLWDGKAWHTLAPFPGDGSPNPSPIELYPCVHVLPDGRLFMSGPAARSYFLDTAGHGEWTLHPGDGGIRNNMRRDYAPSVMYEPGKLLYIGGGNDQGDDQTPTAQVEAIDLTSPAPEWRSVKPMHFARRQHNATLLPDGTVLVTGGTRGPGFNDLTPGAPVHAAELWDPASETWTVLASESVDRCYHSTAILLPDATVLSAGGGEFDAGDHTPNPDKDTHRDAQIFQPPYLFKGPRPVITAAPADVSHGATFAVGTLAPQDIDRITWVRLASATHTNNMNQRFISLPFTVADGELSVIIPKRSELCPPGHYMMFALNRAGVPSVARIIRLTVPPPPAHVPHTMPPVREAAAALTAPSTLEDVDRRLRETARGTQATIGLTSKCPYGLGACWGGAYAALTTLSGVTVVRPVANAADSTADVYLGDDSLPDIDAWARQIAESANGSYDLRGVEISVTGTPVRQGEEWALTGPHFAAPLLLRPLGETGKVQFNRAARQPRPATPEEMAAYDALVEQLGTAGDATRVTGPLSRDGDRWLLSVRAFRAPFGAVVELA